MKKIIIAAAGAVLAAVAVLALIADFNGISAAETALCGISLAAGISAVVYSVEFIREKPEPPEPNVLFEENEALHKELTESKAEIEGLRGYIADLLPSDNGGFRESFVLLGMVFTPAQLMDRLNELIGGELAQRGLDFSVDISPALPEKLCGDMPRLAMAACEMISAAAARTQSGRISLEILAAGGGRLELRVSDTGSPFTREVLEEALMGNFGDEYSYASRTAAIMHGELKLRNIGTGASASLTALMNYAENTEPETV